MSLTSMAFVKHVNNGNEHGKVRTVYSSLPHWLAIIDALSKTRLCLLAAQPLKALPIVLILNKLDVFKQLIRKYPLAKWFPDFVGKEEDPEGVLSYIVAIFEAAISLYDKREIKFYIIDATDIEACQATLRNIEDTVMSKTFESGESRRQTASFKIGDLRRFYRS
ncbi:MAG: hypothetical protein Q9192_007084 [Flavoplaca navasiana]